MRAFVPMLRDDSKKQGERERSHCTGEGILEREWLVIECLTICVLCGVRQRPETFENSGGSLPNQFPMGVFSTIEQSKDQENDS